MIRDNIGKIREGIPVSVTLVAISKGRNLEEIKEAIEAGITDIGENKVQEALTKHNDMRYAISDKPIRWHMVGHLQTNKVKEAVQIFDLIQSVDSLRLAEEINKEAGKINKVQDILIEVKTSSEKAKFGFKPQDTIEAAQEISKLRNINLKGLMTIAPIVDNPEKARPYFRIVKDLYDRINRLSTINYKLSTISMGMSDDFKIAIEEGSNMVRLGRGIFGG